MSCIELEEMKVFVVMTVSAGGLRPSCGRGLSADEARRGRRYAAQVVELHTLALLVEATVK